MNDENMDKQQNMPEEEAHQPLLEMREEPKKTFFTPKVKKEIREWAISLGVAIIAVLLIRTFLFTVIRVQGPSMNDTLYTGDRMIVTILDVKLKGVDRFDVVICDYPEVQWKHFVKRIIGLPGEKIAIRDGITYINGEPLEEPFLAEERTVKYLSGRYDFDEITIPEDCYFVMGDNRDNSNDSREVGFVTKDMLIGKARFIMWPLNRIGTVAGSEEYGG